uniref:Uncharacterized protein n=1 Tax=Arundo donax TaxID=35708 RepID=A0A0A9C329_ARUDO
MGYEATYKSGWFWERSSFPAISPTEIKEEQFMTHA